MLHQENIFSSGVRFSSAALHGEMPDCSDLRLEREEDTEGEKKLD